MYDYKHLKSKDSFFSENPLSDWDLPNYFKYYEEKHSQKSKKSLEGTFLCHLKNIARDPSISEELKDSVNNIAKESENKDENQDKSRNCIKVTGNVISSNISFGASSSNTTIERQITENAIEQSQTTENAIEEREATEERQKLRNEIDDFFNPLPTGNASNKRK